MRAEVVWASRADRTPSSSSPSAARSLIVEFLGLPASGKTTLARHLCEWFTAQGIPAQAVLSGNSRSAAAKLREHGGSVAYLARRDPRVLRAMLALGEPMRYRPVTWSRLGLNWCSLSARHLRLRQTGGVRLVDQAAYQLLWSLAFACGPAVVPRTLALLGTSFPVPDAVVLVNASRERVLERLAERTGTDALKRGLASGAQHSEVHLRGAAALAAVAAVAERDMRGCFFTVDNDGSVPLEQNAAALGLSLQQLQAPLDA